MMLQGNLSLLVIGLCMTHVGIADSEIKREVVIQRFKDDTVNDQRDTSHVSAAIVEQEEKKDQSLHKILHQFLTLFFVEIIKNKKR